MAAEHREGSFVRSLEVSLHEAGSGGNFLNSEPPMIIMSAPLSMIS
jgi:hypothetical protein